MNHFKKPDGSLHAFDDGYAGELITEDMEAITAEEAASLRAPTADDIKAAVWNAIKAERDRRIQNGGYKVGPKWFHSDTFSRTQQMGLVMLGANMPAQIQWKTLDGSFVTMTPTLAGQIFAAGAASDIALFAVAEAHRAAMEAALDPGSYDFSTGWPLAFGE